MIKKILIALVFSVLIFIVGINFLFSYINICNAKMPRSEMYLGNLTVGSSIAEMKKFYGTPTADGMGFEENRSCTYGKDVVIYYNTLEEKIQSIVVTGNNGWTTPSGFNVGGNIRTVLNAYGSADYTKSANSKKVYFYFHCDKNKPNLGLAILIDENNGKILEIGIYGDNTEKNFAEYYEDLAGKLVTGNRQF